MVGWLFKEWFLVMFAIGFSRVVTLCGLLMLNATAAVLIMVLATRVMHGQSEHEQARVTTGTSDRTFLNIIVSAAICLTSAILSGAVAIWVFLSRT